MVKRISFPEHGELLLKNVVLAQLLEAPFTTFTRFRALVIECFY